MRGVCDINGRTGGNGLTPALDIVAGMMAGMLMGLAWSGHAAVIFAAKPPSFLRERVGQADATRLIVIVVLGLITAFVALGVGAALAADAAMAGVGGDYALLPSAPYLTLVAVLTAVVGLPLIAFMRDKLVHAITWLILATAIYGLLIPNLVLAVQNRA